MASKPILKEDPPAALAPKSEWTPGDVTALANDIVTLCTTPLYNCIPWPSMEHALLQAMHDIKVLAQNGTPLVGKPRPPEIDA